MKRQVAMLVIGMLLGGMLLNATTKAAPSSPDQFICNWAQVISISGGPATTEYRWHRTYQRPWGGATLYTYVWSEDPSNPPEFKEPEGFGRWSGDPTLGDRGHTRNIRQVFGSPKLTCIYPD